MAADPDDLPPPAGVGFTTYADDSPRAPRPDTDDFGPMDAPPLAESRDPPRGVVLAAGGALVALVLALGAGSVLKPHLGLTAPPRIAADDVRAAGPSMTVVVDPVRAPAPAPAASVPAGKLEVFAQPPPAVRAVPSGLAKASTPSVTDAAVAKNAAARSSCAGSGVRRMLCEDPRLARADGRMRQAYAEALAAGAPPEDLRDDQDLWLQARDDAASPDDLLDLYRQRIQELRDLAEVEPQ